LNYSEELTFGRVARLEFAARVGIEALAMAKYFRLMDLHCDGLLGMTTFLIRLEKWEEAEVFGRDAVALARDEAHDAEMELDAAGILSRALLGGDKAQAAIELCNFYLERHAAEASDATNHSRGTKSEALSRLGRHEKALTELGFVQRTKCAYGPHWETLSHAQYKLGQLPEAIKSMENAVEFARTGDAADGGKARALARWCGRSACLYQQAGRREDARRLAREAKQLELSLRA
jgi:tetratricopeptide (TPR) repeat protein